MITFCFTLVFVSLSFTFQKSVHKVTLNFKCSFPQGKKKYLTESPSHLVHNHLIKKLDLRATFTHIRAQTLSGGSLKQWLVYSLFLSSHSIALRPKNTRAKYVCRLRLNFGTNNFWSIFIYKENLTGQTYRRFILVDYISVKLHITYTISDNYILPHKILC